VLLFDPRADRLHVRSREDFDGLDSDDAAVLTALLDQMASEAHTKSGSSILREFEDSLSNAIRITERTSIPVHDVDTTLGELADRHLR
jgi:hypothetical protein